MQKEQIKQLFMEGIDCSQVVLEQYAKELGISREMAYKIAAAFGGGMGQGETRGAVVGAMLVLGMKYGHERRQDLEQKEVLNEKREQFFHLF
ncbi:MAG: C-GCAxxG-C-C family protein [Eubacteriales bacterium]|nr:C-GCAxxG-C-C family protein [Eubacteriales bacterium]